MARCRVLVLKSVWRFLLSSQDTATPHVVVQRNVQRHAEYTYLGGSINEGTPGYPNMDDL